MTSGSPAAPRPVSWPRALAVGFAAVAALVVAFFYVPQFVLVQMSAPARGIRVWLATLWIGLAFVGACRGAWYMTRPSPAAPRGRVQGPAAATGPTETTGPAGP